MGYLICLLIYAALGSAYVKAVNNLGQAASVAVIDGRFIFAAYGSNFGLKTISCDGTDFTSWY